MAIKSEEAKAKIDAAVAKRAAAAQEIKRARKLYAQAIRAEKAAEAAARRKKDDTIKFVVGGMIIAASRQDDKSRSFLADVITRSEEPTNISKSEILAYLSDNPAAYKKVVDDALASGTSPWTDEDAKEMQAIREVAAAHPDRRYLTLPEYGEPDFDAEKDAVKSLGAKYDPENKAWYIPAADLPAREKEFAQWL